MDCHVLRQAVLGLDTWKINQTINSGLSVDPLTSIFVKPNLGAFVLPHPVYVIEPRKVDNK